MTYGEWVATVAGTNYTDDEIFAAGAASRDAEVAELVELYEQALTASWPDGAMGDAFDFWNAARKVRKPC